VWRKGAAVLASATGGALVIESAAVTDSGEYTVEVSDVNGRSSVSTRVEVSDPLTVGDLPAQVSVFPRSRLSLGVKVTSTTAVKYQWRFNGVPIRGATQARLDVSMMQMANAGNYDVLVRNATASRASSVCVVRVLEPLRIVQQPLASTVVNPGQRFELSVGLNWTEGVSYQWVGGADNRARVLAGQTGAKLVIENPGVNDGGGYVVIVSGPQGRLVSSVARVQVNKPASIVRQPQRVLVNAGATAELSVVADGTAPIGYQWYRNGVEVPGATGSRLSIAGVGINDGGTYSVRVSNVALPQGVMSQGAELTVSEPLVLVTQPPASVYVKTGDALNLEVQARGTGTLSYQWVRNGFAIAGQTGSKLSVGSLGVADSGVYAVRVESAVGSGAGRQVLAQVESRGTRVGVVYPVTLLVPPVTQMVGVGGTGRFRVVAYGSGPMKYEWSRMQGDQWLPVGVNAPELLITGVKEEDFAQYRVKVSGMDGDGVSVEGFGLVDLGTGLELDPQPQPQTLASGQALSLSVGVKTAPLAGETFKYQWYCSGVPLADGNGVSGSSTAELKIAAAKTSDTGMYSVVVSGAEFRASVSTPVLVWVNLENPILIPPQVTFAYEGGEARMRVSALGEGLVYQWRRNGVALKAREELSGINSEELVIGKVLPEDAGMYSVEVKMAGAGVGSGTGVVSAEAELLVQLLPKILKQPEEQERNPGEKATLSVGVSADAQTKYQWLFQRTGQTAWLPLAGGALSTVYVSPLDEGDDGLYRVEVSNPAGKVVSDAARVLVKDPAVIQGVLVEPAQADPGTTVRLTAQATGDGLSYDWYRVRNNREEPFPTQKGRTLELSNVSEADEGYYLVKVTSEMVLPSGAASRAVSAKIKMSVNDPVSFAGDLSARNTTVNAGESVLYSVSAAGSAPMFQWFRNGVAIAGGSGGVLRVGNVGAQDAGVYSVSVYNNFSSAGPLVMGRVTVNAPPALVDGVFEMVGGIRQTEAALSADEGSRFVLKAGIAQGVEGSVS
jgi:hypothetical protein